jgi:hypothetical protein
MTVQQTLLEIARELQDQIYDTPIKAKYLSGLALGKWLDNFQRTISGQTYIPPTKFDIYAVVSVYYFLILNLIVMFPAPSTDWLYRS